MDQVKIGKFIAGMRKEQNLTQRELAEQLGVSDRTISKWECGKGMPDTSLMLPLCEALQINVNELLSGSRLSVEEYTKKAEENVMDLIEKNEKSKWNVVMTLIALFLMSVFLVILMGFVNDGTQRISYYIDSVAFMEQALLTGIVLIVSGSLKDFFGAFSAAFKRNRVVSAGDKCRYIEALKLAEKSFIFGGIGITVFYFIYVFQSVSKPDIIRVNMAVALLNLLYGTAGAVLLLPVEGRIKRSGMSHN